MKWVALTVFILLSVFVVYAQDNVNYLNGAVKEVDGRVIFSTVINTGNRYSKKQLFVKASEWADVNYRNKKGGNNNNRVLLSDSETGNIACNGEKYLVFKKSSLVLDQAVLSYQLVLDIDSSRCKATIRNLKFTYYDFKAPEPAEKMITDKVALNKDGSKMNRYYDKFRKHTIDSVKSIFDSLEKYLIPQTQSLPLTSAASGDILQPVPEQKLSTVPAEQITALYHESPSNSPAMPGFHKVDAEKISGNIIRILANDWSLITSGKSDNITSLTASWGGIGRFGDKPVVFSFINTNSLSDKAMDESDTYTVSFFTEAYKEVLKNTGMEQTYLADKTNGIGLTPIKTLSDAFAFNEAWMIFECKKILAQPIPSEALIEIPAPEGSTKSSIQKLYIGEILNVWIK